MKRRDIRNHLPPIDKGLAVRKRSYKARGKVYVNYVSPWTSLLVNMHPGDSFRVPAHYLTTIQSVAKKHGFNISWDDEERMSELGEPPDRSKAYKAVRVWLLSKPTAGAVSQFATTLIPDLGHLLLEHLDPKGDMLRPWSELNPDMQRRCNNAARAVVQKFIETQQNNDDPIPKPEHGAPQA